MKDLFSGHAEQYAKYRPTYPPELFEYLNTLVPNKQKAWDCATGNGQLARELAKTFDRVFATDISQQQINHAPQRDNIHYSVQPAEKTNFAAQQFDLVTVGQAVHWFNFEQFYAEVRRTAKANAYISIVGYGSIAITEPIEQLIKAFHKNVIGPFWDKEAKDVDKKYQTIPFPFNEVQAPQLVSKQLWTFEHLIGYCNTWSAVQHFIKKNGYNPVDTLRDEIEPHWGNAPVREVKFPVLIRIGKL